MVEWGGLENRCACKRTQGSNPCLSAKYFIDIVALIFQKPPIALFLQSYFLFRFAFLRLIISTFNGFLTFFYVFW